MSIIRRFNYFSNKQITTHIIDKNNAYEWIAFAKNSDGNCILTKRSAYNPNQVYFSVDIVVDKIVDMKISGNYLYVAYEDTINIGAKFYTINPITTVTNITRPGGLQENPVAIVTDGTNIYFLTPGIISGTSAQIFKYNTSGTLLDTIDLYDSAISINNATDLVIDSNGDLQIITNTDPAKIVRVFQIDSIWYLQETSIN